MSRYNHKYDNIHPKDILPNCKYCGKPFMYIKRKGLAPIKVDPKPLYYIPEEDGPVNVISRNGNRRRGVIVADGITGYFEHVCRK